MAAAVKPTASGSSKQRQSKRLGVTVAELSAEQRQNLDLRGGVVISDVMYDDMDKLDDAGKKQLDAALHRCQPLEPGRMQDIANTALFFASNMSANITGQTLLSDGGTSIKAHDMDC